MIKQQTTLENTRGINGSQFLANLASNPPRASRCAHVIWNAQRAVIKYTYYSITWWLIDSLHVAHKPEPGIKATHVSHTASCNYEMIKYLADSLHMAGIGGRVCWLSALVCECVKGRIARCIYILLIFFYCYFLFIYKRACSWFCVSMFVLYI